MLTMIFKIIATAVILVVAAFVLASIWRQDDEYTFEITGKTQLTGITDSSGVRDDLLTPEVINSPCLRFLLSEDGKIESVEPCENAHEIYVDEPIGRGIGSGTVTIRTTVNSKDLPPDTMSPERRKRLEQLQDQINSKKGP